MIIHREPFLILLRCYNDDIMTADHSEASCRDGVVCTGIFLLLFSAALLYCYIPKSDIETDLNGLSIIPTNGMTLRSMRLDFSANSRDSISISLASVFETYNRSPSLSILFSLSEAAELVVLENISIIADAVYSQQGTSRLYMVGGYASAFHVTPVRHNAGADYIVNLTSNVEDAFNYAQSQNSSLTIDQIGIIGRLSLYVELSAAIGRDSNTRFISMQLVSDTDLVEGSFGLTIPSGGTFIIVTYQGVELDRIDPNVAIMPFPIVPGTMLDGHLYAEWSSPPVSTIAPCSFLISSLFGAFVSVTFALTFEHRKTIWTKLRRYSSDIYSKLKDFIAAYTSRKNIENK